MSETSSQQKVGFVGLGNMGGRMTSRLTGAGIPVLGYDPVPGRAEATGAGPAASVADVARSADIILLSLPDSRVVEGVALGPDGLLANARDSQVIVDLSTCEPESTRRLSAAFGERGAVMLDAGISGGAAAADAGKLTLMVGGDRAVLDSIAWVLAPISSTVHHLGESGSGHVMKLLNNFLNAVSLAATAEVMVAAKKSGLPLETVLDVLNTSSGANWATAHRFPHIIHGDYLEGGLTTKLMTKDILLYVDHLAATGVASLNSSGPLASFGLASARGYADQISNRVVDAIGDVSGGVRLSENEG